jgi:hypothetical protein
MRKKSAGCQAFVLRYSGLDEQKETICKKGVSLLREGVCMKVLFLMRISRCDAVHYQVKIIQLNHNGICFAFNPLALS